MLLIQSALFDHGVVDHDERRCCCHERRHYYNRKKPYNNTYSQICLISMARLGWSCELQLSLFHFWTDAVHD
jgi:hypothetical protein